MIFQPLASSSHGNAYIVHDDCTHILIECGVAFQTLQKLCGFKITAFDGCLVSHEHKDHSRCVDKVIQSGVPVYLSQGTAVSLELSENLLDMVNEMAAGQQFTIGSIDVLPFPTYHDAEEPLGFCLRSRLDGETVVFAIDTVSLPYRFPDVQILAVEANYDPQFYEWLAENLPEGSVERRSAEKRAHRVQNTHMSIDRLCECLCGMDLSKCRELWLMHLSDSNSHEGNFINKASRAVPPTVKVMACPR